MSEKAPEQLRKPGKRRWRVVVVLCALAVGVAAVALWPEEKQPEYQGKTLSYWIEASRQDNSVEKERAMEAAHHIGRNALPFLLKWIQHESWQEKKMWPLVRRLPPRLQQTSAIQSLLASGANLNDRGVRGFELIGTEASPGIGELSRIAKSQRPLVVRRALTALSYIGEPAYPILYEFATNQGFGMRYYAVGMIGYSKNLGSNSTPAVTFLGEAVNDADTHVARHATYVLRNFSEHADAIPALVKLLRSRDPILRFIAIGSLAAFGGQASVAVPELVGKLNDPDARVRRAATDALLKIAPEVLKTNVTGVGHE